MCDPRHGCISVCTHINRLAHVCSLAHTGTHRHTDIHTQAHTNTYTSTRMHIYTQEHTHKHTHIYVQAHTRRHIKSQSLSVAPSLLDLSQQAHHGSQRHLHTGPTTPQHSSATCRQLLWSPEVNPAQPTTPSPAIRINTPCMHAPRGLGPV
jgi:hypothetical protein